MAKDRNSSLGLASRKRKIETQRELQAATQFGTDTEVWFMLRYTLFWLLLGIAAIALIAHGQA